MQRSAVPFEATATGRWSGRSWKWICYFKPDVIRREFGLPYNLEPVNILTVGYADEKPADEERHAQTRIPVEELVTYETM